MNGAVVYDSKNHNHILDTLKNEALIVKHEIREAATASSSENPAQIVSKCLATVPDHVLTAAEYSIIKEVSVKVKGSGLN
jgi:hypothetical protein